MERMIKKIIIATATFEVLKLPESSLRDFEAKQVATAKIRSATALTIISCNVKPSHSFLNYVPLFSLSFA